MRSTRRDFLTGSGAALGALGLAPGLPVESRAAAQEPGAWNQGALVHLLPMASHDRILIKTSISRPLDAAPVLRAGARSVAGAMSDTTGRFWQFDLGGLEAGREHALQLFDAGSEAIDARLDEETRWLDSARDSAKSCWNGVRLASSR